MDTIEPKRKVADLLEEHPHSYHVFRKYGCPDMRKGFFSLMARMMSIRNAALIHRIPLDELLDDLEESMQQEKDSGSH